MVIEAACRTVPLSLPHVSTTPSGQEVVFFLCCSSADCERFTHHLRGQKLHNEVRSVAESRNLVADIEGLPPSKGPVLVVLDGDIEHVWDGYDALRASHLKTVPVLAICEPDDADRAYARGVNAVLPREHWEKDFASTVSRLTSFWLNLVRLPKTL